MMKGHQSGSSQRVRTRLPNSTVQLTLFPLSTVCFDVDVCDAGLIIPFLCVYPVREYGRAKQGCSRDQRAQKTGSCCGAYTPERYAESKQMALWVKNPTGKCHFSRYSKDGKSSVIYLIASLTVLCSAASDEVTVISRHRLALLKQHRWSDVPDPAQHVMIVFPSS